MVTEIVEWACGGETEEDPSVHYYVPGVPLTKPELIRAIREHNLKSVSAVFDYLAGGKEDAASKPGLASLLKTLWQGEYEDETRRALHQRARPRQYPEGRNVFRGPADSRRHHQPRAVAAHRRRGGEISCAAGEAHRRPAHRSAGHQERRSAEGVAAISTCLPATRMARATAPARAAWVRISAASDWATASSLAIEDRERNSRASTVPHKMKLATAGCPRNCSEAMVKDVGAVAVEGGKWEIYIGGAAGSSRPQRRHSMRRRQPRRRPEIHGPLHSVLSRKRQVSGAHPRLRERAWASRRFAR